jgi:cell division protein FtsB
MTTNHRTSSIQRPITGEVTRPTRRRHRSADGTPGRGLPERPLPGRPGNVLRASTTATTRPGTPRRRAAPATSSRRPPAPATERPPKAATATEPKAAARRSPAAARTAGPPTAAMPLTEPLVRSSSPVRREGGRRGSARPGGVTRPTREASPLRVVAEPQTPRGFGPADVRPAPDTNSVGRARRATKGTARRAAADATTPARTGRTSRRGRAGSNSTTDQPRSSPLRDVTRPIARDSRMAQRRPARIGYGLVAAAIGLALVAALVVLPVRRWWNQRADLADRKSELDILRQANAQLGDKVAALNTPEGIEAEARTALNWGYPGEERTRSVGDPQAPMVLPPGFPYSLVNAILGSRANLAAAPPSPDGSVATDPAAGDATTSDTASTPTAAPEPTIAPPPGNPLSPVP